MLDVVWSEPEARALAVAVAAAKVLNAPARDLQHMSLAESLFTGFTG